MDLFHKIISLNYFSNNINNFNLLRSEFTGIVINPFGILHFIFNVLFVTLIFFIFYYIGDYLRGFLKFENKYYSPFVNFAFGYIFIGMTIAFLGILNLLYVQSIFILLTFCSIVSLYRFHNLSHHKKALNFIKKPKINFTKNIYTLIVIFIISIAFIRLLIPDVNEDGYHTDLARLYLSSHTITHEARDPLFVIPYSQLPEMIYILPTAFTDKEANRIIHFTFYLLTVLLLFRIAKEEKFAKFAPLIFTTTPVVMRYASSQYTDFFMTFCFVLSVVILTIGKTKEKFLSGILVGAVYASKVWTLIFIPIFILHILITERKNKISQIKYTAIFSFGILLVAAFWQLRSFFLTKNIFFPLLSTLDYIGRSTLNANTPKSSIDILKLNLFFINNNIKLLSPLLIFGLLLLLLNILKLYKELKKSRFVLFAILLTALQVLFGTSHGRYLYPWVGILSIFASYGIYISINKFKLLKYAVLFFSFIFIFYYFLSTILLLPYGIGWANKESYLTRTMIRDNASYYDFDGNFKKFINKNDLVATYEIYSFYYADFNHIDVNYIFDVKHLSFDLLKKYGATKLLLKGGDINWFCKKLNLLNCTPYKYKYLSSYTNKFYLYKIK